jgi:dolichol-phosphate mannosyltransferase
MRAVDVSIVIPIFNEAENIPLLVREIRAAMDGAPWRWETVWVNDGSTDGTESELLATARDNPGHRFIGFAENSGQSAALLAGFREAEGKYLATLDGDGQNDPADIPRLLDSMSRQGVDMVNGYRANRRDSFVRRASSRTANFTRNLLTGRTVRDVGCSTRVMRKECTDYLPHFAGMHRFLPTLVSMYGFTLAEEPVNHRPRQTGQTKYGIGNRLWVGLLDLFGVWWLRKRRCVYKIEAKQNRSDFV